jgi:hypothetical protein
MGRFLSVPDPMAAFSASAASKPLTSGKSASEQPKTVLASISPLIASWIRQ